MLAAQGTGLATTTAVLLAAATHPPWTAVVLVAAEGSACVFFGVAEVGPCGTRVGTSSAAESVHRPAHRLRRSRSIVGHIACGSVGAGCCRCCAGAASVLQGLHKVGIGGVR
jgi:hypothetical protein